MFKMPLYFIVTRLNQMKKINSLDQILGGFNHTFTFSPVTHLVEYSSQSFSFHGPDGSIIRLTGLDVFDSIGNPINDKHRLYTQYGFRVSRRYVMSATEQVANPTINYTATVSWN